MKKVWTTKVITLYPEMFPGALKYSVTGKALENKLWSIKIINLRDFGCGKHKNVDDSPAGGGAGMILRADVVSRSLDSATADLDTLNETWPIICLTPRGNPLSQKISKTFAQSNGIIVLCGKFEGIDERVIKKWKMLEVSIGDFIISGGEIAAMALIDSCVRHIPGVLGNKESNKRESFTNDLLEYPQYTRPANWNGLKIPHVLLSGHHEKIEAWRTQKSLDITKKRRPDLWKKYKKNP